MRKMRLLGRGMFIGLGRSKRERCLGSECGAGLAGGVEVLRLCFVEHLLDILFVIPCNIQLSFYSHYRNGLPY